MKNLLSATVLFVLFAVSACSLQDHNIPTLPISIKTLPIEFDSGTWFNVQVDNLGDKAVKEYGAVYTSYYKGVGNHNYQPTIANARVKFSTPIALGKNQQKFNGDFIFGQTFFYYRAYAILEDDSVVYGDMISFTVPH